MLTRITGNSIQDATLTTAELNFANGQISGFRNRIINGACEIAQRGNTIAAPAAANTYGGPDRFRVINSSNGQFTQSKSTLTMPNGLVKSACRQTVDTPLTDTTGQNRWSGIRQTIEGFNCYDLLGKKITVSFLFNSNISGTFPVAVRTGVTSASYVTTITYNTPGVPVYYSIPVDTIPLTAGIPNTTAAGMDIVIGIISTGDWLTTTTNSWVVGNFLTTTGMTNWGTTIGNFIEVTELQVEEGSVATPFERRQYGQELVLCQRYYENGLTAAWHGNTYGTHYFKVTKRSTPTLTTTPNSAGTYANLLVDATSFYGVYSITVGFTWTASAEI